VDERPFIRLAMLRKRYVRCCFSLSNWRSSHG
jgi:hypothetical protein